MADPAQERIAALEQRLAKEPQSPLFARLAAYYLQVGRSKDALRLCDDGLANYPYYATAHLIKGKVLANLGMMAEAKHEYEVVHEFLPTNETVAKLYTSIELPGGPEKVAPPVEKGVAQPVVAAVSPPPVVVKEPVVEEPPVTVVEEAPPQEPVAEEAPFAAAEEPPVQEVVAEGPPVTAQTEVAPTPEDLSGFGETPAVEAEPETQSAADKLGIEWKEEPQQTLSDYGFGSTPEPPAIAAIEESPFGAQQTEELPPESEAAPEPAQEQAPAEQLEAEPAQATLEPAAETPAADADQNPDWFDAFSQLEQPAGEVTEAPPPAPAEEENPFAMFETEQPSTPPAEGEAYEEYTARVRMELFGTEDTMTLDEYLGGSSPSTSTPPPESTDNIGQLAEKLKTSPRITPPVINFSEKARATGDGGMPNGSGIVTPTLAEIYVKQGWYDDAIKAYRVLATNKPAEKEKYEQRIAEIEEMKKKQ